MIEQAACLRKIVTTIVTVLVMTLAIHANAAKHAVDLHVNYKKVNFTGRTRVALAVNNQIPAPTLRFKEGDEVTLNVYNHLKEETAMHWHGIILPWQMDGVLGLTQKGIQPGSVFHYKFKLRQSGTYWYHAHAGLQEQEGLYGALVIEPKKHSSYHYNKDFVMVLSDWSNTNANQILANLKKEGDYYSPLFPLQPSLVKFLTDYKKSNQAGRQTLLDEYKMMQQMRMSIYDYSDVAYDAFLLNGHPNANPWSAVVKKGDVVRLRFIGAGGSTIFHVKIPGTMMSIVNVDGNDVKPYRVNDFSIAPGETFDVLVKITKQQPYIIYAESNDTLGAALGALKHSPNQEVGYQQVKPFPEPLPVTRDMMSLMMGPKITGNTAVKVASNKAMPVKQQTQHKNMHHMKHAMKPMKMQHDSHVMTAAKPNKIDHDTMMKNTGEMMDMSMPTESTIIGDSMSPPTTRYATSSGTKYQQTIAAVKTNDPTKPVFKVIKMELFGYMDRYVWFINGIPEYLAKPIILQPAKRYRIVFTNTSMMHHPMHIHGHWFIMRKGNGAYDPLLHTIDVAPGATITADLDTDASGQWFFHCHMLYHMMSGMARVFQYSTLIELVDHQIKPEDIIKKTGYKNRPIVRVDEVRPLDVSLVKEHSPHKMGLWLASFLDVDVDPINDSQSITYKGMVGSDYNKLELFIKDAETSKGVVENADLDVFAWRLVDQFWAVKAGLNYFYRPATTPYWQPGVGIEGLMPYYIDTDLRAYYHDGSVKLDIDLSRDTQITNNFFVQLGIRGILATKTVQAAGIGVGLNQMRYVVRPYYRVMPALSVGLEYEKVLTYGAYQRIQRATDGSTSETSLSLSLSLIF